MARFKAQHYGLLPASIWQTILCERAIHPDEIPPDALVSLPSVAIGGTKFAVKRAEPHSRSLKKASEGRNGPASTQLLRKPNVALTHSRTDTSCRNTSCTPKPHEPPSKRIPMDSYTTPLFTCPSLNRQFTRYG